MAWPCTGEIARYSLAWVGGSTKWYVKSPLVGCVPISVTRVEIQRSFCFVLPLNPGGTPAAEISLEQSLEPSRAPFTEEFYSFFSYVTSFTRVLGENETEQGARGDLFMKPGFQHSVKQKPWLLRHFPKTQHLPDCLCSWGCLAST